MMAGPGDERVGTHGQGRGIRASHADREQVIEVLKDAFVQGRLTRHELDSRAGRAFTSRTYAELAVLTADIPAWLTGAESSPRPVKAQVRTRPPVGDEIKTGARAIAAMYLVAGVLWLGTVLAGDEAADVFFFPAFMVSVVAVFFTLHGTVVLLLSQRDKRSARKLSTSATM
jgi:hypothetical protein